MGRRSMWLLTLMTGMAFFAAAPVGAAQDNSPWRWNIVSNEPVREAGRIVDFAVRVEAPLDINVADAAATPMIGFPGRLWR